MRRPVTQGGASLYSTGSSPGFITEALPCALLSLQRRLDQLLIEEFADMSSRNSPEMIFDLMGFGRDPARFDPRGVEAHGGSSFAGSLATVADALSLPLDDVVANAVVAIARQPVEIAAGRIEAGTVAAQRLEVVGHAGREAAADLPGQLVPDPRRGARPGTCATRAGTCWSRVTRPLDIDIHFPVARRGLGGHVARSDRPPPGQRRALRLCRRTRDPHDGELPQIIPNLVGRRGCRRAS